MTYLFHILMRNYHKFFNYRIYCRFLYTVVSLVAFAYIIYMKIDIWSIDGGSRLRLTVKYWVWFGYCTNVGFSVNAYLGVDDFFLSWILGFPLKSEPWSLNFDWDWSFALYGLSGCNCRLATSFEWVWNKELSWKIVKSLESVQWNGAWSRTEEILSPRNVLKFTNYSRRRKFPVHLQDFLWKISAIVSNRRSIYLPIKIHTMTHQNTGIFRSIKRYFELHLKNYIDRMGPISCTNTHCMLDIDGLH